MYHWQNNNYQEVSDEEYTYEDEEEYEDEIKDLETNHTIDISSNDKNCNTLFTTSLPLQSVEENNIDK